MKSLMKSYNSGNVAFYENLHRKYFDKAKDKDAKAPPNFNDNEQALPSGLDMTDASRIDRDDSLGHSKSRSLSRSRSRSKGYQSNPGTNSHGQSNN